MAVYRHGCDSAVGNHIVILCLYNRTVWWHKCVNKLGTTTSVISASVIYLFLLEHSYKPLSITTVWAKDLNEDVHVFLSDQVWGMFKLSSKNPNHQIINWKLLHRVYLTPMKCFYMNLSSFPMCNLCSQGSLGTFLHFFWECPSHLFGLSSHRTYHICWVLRYVWLRAIFSWMTFGTSHCPSNKDVYC